MCTGLIGKDSRVYWAYWVRLSYVLALLGQVIVCTGLIGSSSRVPGNRVRFSCTGLIGSGYRVNWTNTNLALALKQGFFDCVQNRGTFRWTVISEYIRE